jgi:hypothetical protein
VSATFVYIVAPTDADGPCKVGISSNPDDRFGSLQTGSPVRLRLVEVYWFESRAEAAAMERQFHESYAARRLHGEWFDVQIDDANYWLFENTVVPDAVARGFM